MIYQSRSSHIARVCTGKDSAEKRLALDVADILTGPTSRAKAEELAAKIVASAGSEWDLATAMREAADRYFANMRTP